MPRQPRVLFVDRSRFWGGAEQSLAEMVIALSRKGVEVGVVVDFPMPHHERFVSSGIEPIPRYPARPRWFAEAWSYPPRGLDRLGSILAARRLALLARSLDYNIIHLNLLGPRSIFDLAACHRHSLWTVGHARELNSASIRSKKVMHACNRIITNSKAGAYIVQKSCPSVQTTTIHNVVDPSIYNPELSQEIMRDRFSLPKDQVIIVSPHVLFTGKGHEVGIQALAQLRDDGLGGILVIAGGEPPRRRGSGSSRMGALRDLALDLGVSDRVVFLGDVQSMRGLYAASDVVIFPTYMYESFGRVAAEGALMERPVVASRIGALPELVRNNETGFLVPPGNPGAMAASLSCLIQDRVLRRKFGKAGRAHVLGMVAPDLVAGKLCDLYAGVLCGR